MPRTPQRHGDGKGLDTQQEGRNPARCEVEVLIGKAGLAQPMEAVPHAVDRIRHLGHAEIGRNELMRGIQSDVPDEFFQGRLLCFLVRRNQTVHTIVIRQDGMFEICAVFEAYLVESI